MNIPKGKKSKKQMIKTAKRSSSAAEDYLERIQELIDAKGYARTVDIALSLGISQASVTNMVKRLDAEGFVKHERYRGLILTEEGRSIARAVADRHRILTEFLGLLGISEAEVERDVEGMEHHLSTSSLSAIEALCRELASNRELLERVRLASGEKK
jgi:Mn-dependent DtxR family transcriptional regulator